MNTPCSPCIPDPAFGRGITPSSDLLPTLELAPTRPLINSSAHGTRGFILQVARFHLALSEMPSDVAPKQRRADLWAHRQYRTGVRLGIYLVLICAELMWIALDTKTSVLIGSTTEVALESIPT